MRSIQVLLTVLVLGSCCGRVDRVFQDPRLRAADEKFEQGLFAEAYAAYEDVWREEGDEAERWKAFYRSVECLSLQYRYGEAVQRLMETEAPRTMPFRARYLWLKAETLQGFSRQYSSIQGEDVVEGPEGADVFHMTPDQVRSEVHAAYVGLWKERARLVEMPIEDEAYFLDVQGVDRDAWPTAFDYVVYSWVEHLVGRAGAGDVRPTGDTLVVADLEREVNLADPPALLAVELMEEAGRFEDADRIEAAERWRVERLTLPLESGLFDLEDEETARLRAESILVRWFSDMRSTGGRAAAGFAAASLMDGREAYVEAVELCRKVEDRFGRTYAAHEARKLREGIEEPRVILSARTALPPAAGALELRTRNRDEVALRLYSIEPRAYREEFEREHAWQSRWSSLLGHLDREWLGTFMGRHDPAFEWDQRVDDPGDHSWVDTVADVPELDEGIYLVVASPGGSFDVGGRDLYATFLNVTDLVLVGTAGPTRRTREGWERLVTRGGPSTVDDDVFRFYAVDARSGEPVDDARVTVRSLTGGTPGEHELSTDATGRAALSLPVSVRPDAFTVDSESSRPAAPVRLSADPLASRDGAHAYWSTGHSTTYAAPNPVSVFLHVDRPIYRPGHTVQARAVAVRRGPSGYVGLEEGRVMTFLALDANAEEFYREDVELGPFGSASVSFALPAGKLLGAYRLRAFVDAGRFQGVTTTRFRVEEYERPEFEVEIDEATEAWKYGEAVRVTGSVSYYFGGPVPDADVEFTVRRRTWVPWLYRSWCRTDGQGGEEQVASGRSTTDGEGRFEIALVPEAPPRRPWQEKVPDVSTYTVEVRARDAGGRTIRAARSYRAGENALYFTATPSRGFFDAEHAPALDVALMTINDTPAEGRSRYTVHRLADEPADPVAREDEHRATQSAWRWMPPLEVQLAEVESGDEVASGRLAHDESGRAAIELDTLPPGAYRVELAAPDPWGGEVSQERVFVVAGGPDAAVPVRAASVTLPERGTYLPGETARVAIGSDLGSRTCRVEVWAGRYLADSWTLAREGPAHLITVPVTPEMEGGFTVRWFTVADLEVHHGEVAVDVPHEDETLDVELDPFSGEMEPGEEVDWGVTVRARDGSPARSEVLALMYDRALEYYAGAGVPWVSSLYSGAGRPPPGADSVFVPNISTIWAEEGLLDGLGDALDRDPAPPRAPGLRTWRSWAAGRDGLLSRLGLRNRGAKMLSQAVEEEKAAMPEAADGEVPPSAAKAKRAADETGTGGEPPPVDARTAFADTAFFMPHVATGGDGRAELSFVAPEQLTSWRVKLFAFTPEAAAGSLVEQAVTRKELMVRADVPRFLRERDAGTLTAVVHNESEAPLEGDLHIDVRQGSTSIAAALGLSATQRRFEVEPHALASFHWPVEVPEGVTEWGVRVTAVAGDLADAEARRLPILPSRQRLVESSCVALSGGGRRTLSVDLPEDPGRVDESVIVQLDPQLALSLINTIPFLVEYPHECVEQTLNRYVPLAVLNGIYRAHPELSAALEGLERRGTVTPPWEEDDPRRLITLMETPWVRQAGGTTPPFPVTDLLEPAIVDAEREIALSRLRAAQREDGAFPWWPGGRPSLYTTLLVLAGFAEGRRHGVDVPPALVDAALGYVVEEIPRVLTDDERDLALTAYAAWVLTSYPVDEFDSAGEGRALARGWTKHLEKHVHALTPFGKAYLASTLSRLGDEERAGELLDMIMDASREDPVVGVYWQPEKYSWVWYRDTVEKHAFMLRTLLEVRPGDPRIPGMVRWLLFNRKGNRWKSTKASAAAVFSLLEYMERTGALSSSDAFVIRWADATERLVVEPDDFFEEPIRFFATGEEITPAHSTATVEKDGPGTAFASMTWIYTTDELPEASAPGLLGVARTFYRRVQKGGRYHLVPVGPDGEVHVGDEIVVRLEITAAARFEFMHVKDPRPAGFESETLLSGWRHDPLWVYEEPRDSLTNFFMDRLPAGEYVLSYTVRPTKPGTYRAGAAVLQSMYAPEMTAHSAGRILTVVE